MSSRLAAAALLALWSGGCVSTQVLVPAEQRASLKRQLQGEERYLRVSCYLTPFFGDATKRLLSPVSPEQVRLLENPDGTPILPGPAQGIVPAGTVVRIKTVEFPTPVVQTERVLMTPRMLAWVYLDVAGTGRDAPPSVLVLRPRIRDEGEFNAEVDRVLSRQDVAPVLAEFSDSVREAISKKEAVPDMPAAALEMAWGYPERRQLAFEGERRKETWVWPDGKRSVVLLDGRVAQIN